MRHWPWSARTWRATAFVVLDLVVALVVGVTVVVLLSLGLSLLVLLVGVPVLLAMFVVVAVAARLEVARVEVFLGPRIVLRPAPERVQGFWRTIWSQVSSGTPWLRVGYFLIKLVLAPVFFGLLIGWWGFGLALALMPAYGALLPPDALLAQGIWLWAIAAGGLVAVLAVPWVAEGMVRADTWLARGMLGTTEARELSRQLARVTESRAAAVSSADSERRRIERDLHDGAQQRLVSLAMNLGRAQQKMETDPEGARLLVDQAHTDAKAAIVDLRNVIRGVAPPVLSERGLDAALSALAARSPVPVHVSVQVPVRPSPTVESVAYFVVSEALTNVARHARATRAAVHVERDGWVLVVTVADDGVGGADLAAGSGLRGLQDRLAAVDGRLTVTSVPLGGTTVQAVIPCAA